MWRSKSIKLLSLFIWLLFIPYFPVNAELAEWSGTSSRKGEIERESLVWQQKAAGDEDLSRSTFTAYPTAFKKNNLQRGTTFRNDPATKSSFALSRKNGAFVTPSKFEKVSKKTALKPESLMLEQSQKSAVSINYSARDLHELELSQLLIVTDIEGGVHALKRHTGESIWSIEGPKFPPLINVEEPANLTNETLIVEPYGDGNIYYFNLFQGLQKLPISIKQLVNASPLDLKTNIAVDNSGNTIEDEKIYTGARKTAVFTIDIVTGEIISVFGPGTENKVFKRMDINCTNSFDNIACENVVVLGKTSYELGIHSKDGTVYNVTYSTWQQNSLDNNLAMKNVKSQDGMYIAPFRDKSLLAIDTDFQMAKWMSSQFSGAINNVFDVYVDRKTNEKILLPHPLKIENSRFENDKVYVDQTEDKCWFAMSSEYYPSLVDSAAISKYSLYEEWRTSNLVNDKTLFRTAIVGVHELQSLQYEQVPKYDDDYNYYSLPENPKLLIGGSMYGEKEQGNEVIIKKEPSKALERYVSPEDLFAYRLRMQEEIARDILSKNHDTIGYMFARFIYRIIEGGLMLVFSFFVLVTLSKLKIIPPLYFLLEKTGVTQKSDLKTAPIEITENVSIEKTASGTEKHVSIQEPEFMNVNEHKDESTSEKRRRKRGSRGGKKNKKKVIPPAGKEFVDVKESELENDLKHLAISEKVLGYGSSGTVVFQGSFQERPVAVKRMLIEFYDIASREIRLLTESDHHPNVIRYYCSEVTEKFLYIALELCTSTLDDLIELKSDSEKLHELRKNLDPINILYQTALGVAHLHSMKIIHRDLKPQNILIAPSLNYSQHISDKSLPVRVLISDFGLCKKLEAGQSSFRTNINNASGTSGWRAPELLDENFSEPDYISDSDNTEGSWKTTDSPLFIDPLNKKRLTRAIDIFSLGCIFYYVLSKGKHPFGERFMREGNVIRGDFSLSDLDNSLNDRYLVIEAKNLISQMICHDPRKRPFASQILKHPLFWSIPKKLDFLLKVSDRFEVERRDPPSDLLLKLEDASIRVIPNQDWTVKFDGVFMNNLGKYRKYSGSKLMDLLRALRNKYHHFMDLPNELSEVMGPIPNGFYLYFIRRFPNLLLEIYRVVEENLKDDQILADFF